MRHLVVAGLVSPLALVVATGAAAQTVSSNTSSNIRTSTAANGSPSDVSVSTGVTVSPPSGAAITIDSNNSVTNNGTLNFTDVANATGIAASSGLTGSITNAGTITVTETSTATDENGDGAIDGPFATGANRFGIHVTGAGAFTGTITNSGTITVVGNASGGIAVDDQLAGSLVSSGTIAATGANSYGIHLGSLTGDLTVSGGITATGQGATGVAVDGAIGGAVALSSTIVATGYRGGATAYATPVADDLLIGGPAVQLGGSVTGGVSLASGGVLTSYGSAPALLLGGASGTATIGLVSGSSYGLVIAGTASGLGVNIGVAGAGVQLGGLGGSLAITGGASVTGTVSASGNQASATALTIGSGTSVPTLAVTGTVGATAGAGAFTATGLVVNAGGSLPAITNSGTISGAGTNTAGTSYAIRDLSGTLTAITNAGAITATITGTHDAAQTVAIDLSANTSGVAIAQGGTGAPVITGNILTGSGNDILTLPIGTVTGNVSLGAGNDAVVMSGKGALVGNVDFGIGIGTLTMAGTSSLTGGLTFGAGSSVSIADSAVFTGNVVQNGNPFALTVSGGTFAATNAGSVALTSLTLGASGTLGVAIDTSAGTSTLYQVAGTASLASGATIKLSVANFLAGSQTYAIVSAGSLTGGTGLTVASAGLPYLYAASLATAGNQLALTLAPKTAAQLGLNRSGTAAYAAIYKEAQLDAKLGPALLSVDSASSFQNLYDQLLPEHAGGLFLSMQNASQSVADMIGARAAPMVASGALGVWIGQFGSYLQKDRQDSEAYTLTGYGLAGGVEYQLGRFGAVGLQVDWSYNNEDNRENKNTVLGYLTEVGAYWHGQWGGLNAYARGAYGWMSNNSARTLLSPTDSSTVLYTANADWSGTSTAIDGGAGYEVRLGKHLTLRPAVAVDYFRLSEDAHSETGGGPGFDLALAQRKSDALVGNYSLALGYRFSRDADSASRVEVELGDRERINGGVGDTIASYADGTTYTLQGDPLRYGPLARLRLAIGSDVISALASVSGQKVEGQVAASFTAGVRLAL